MGSLLFGDPLLLNHFVEELLWHKVPGVLKNELQKDNDFVGQEYNYVKNAILTTWIWRFTKRNKINNVMFHF